MVDVILINGTQGTIMYIWNAIEDYFGSTGKGSFDTTVFFRLGNNFLKLMQKCLDEIEDGEFDIPEEEVPKTMQEKWTVLYQKNQQGSNPFTQTFEIT